MPKRSFNMALKKLDQARRMSVTNQLNVWSKEPKQSATRQIAKNISRETGLPIARFTALLQDFADALVEPLEPLKAWEKACADHRFAISPLAASDRPLKMGRACKFDMFLRYSITSDRTWKHSLTKYAGNSKPLTSFKNTLQLQYLGGPVTFATFNEADSTLDPFSDLPMDTDAIRTALGLGQDDHTSSSPYLLFRYDPESPSHLSLHRPSIADAGTFSYFRPAPSVKNKYGQTLPIAPNKRGLPSKPEIIHSQASAAHLVFPYHITTP